MSLLAAVAPKTLPDDDNNDIVTLNHYLSITVSSAKS